MAAPSSNRSEAQKFQNSKSEKSSSKSQSFADAQSEEDMDLNADFDGADLELEAEESDDDMPNDSKWSDAKQVRGSELRAKMENSRQDGKDYRALHQGKDVVELNRKDTTDGKNKNKY